MSTEEEGKLDCFDAKLVVSSILAHGKLPRHMAPQSVAEKAIAAGISVVKFDRGGYLYHGRIKSLAEGAREGGLKF